MNQMQKNKINGRLAQVYSQQDFIENGFSVTFVGDRGFDFIAYQLTSNPLLYVVEVKYNKSRLTRLQKLFQYHCKKSKINYFVYRVTQDQLRYWLNERGVSF